MARIISGRFEIIEKLGGGGMGTVYKARHTSLDTFFALKALPQQNLDDSIAVARFEREARIQARLNHPGIVRTYDLTLDGDVYYLIQDYIEGEDLSRHVKRLGPIAPTDALEIACQIADALSYAHAQNVVHRDIKPHNVMIRSGRRREALLTDFGIAVESDASSGLTQPGSLVGSYRYSAPEQLGYRPSELAETDDLIIDLRADLYSLGLVIYEMVEGAPPFPGLKVQELIAQVVVNSGPLTPRFSRSVSPMIEELVSCATHRERGERPGSMSEYLGMIEACLADEQGGEDPTIAIPPPSPSDSLRDAAERKQADTSKHRAQAAEARAQRLHDEARSAHAPELAKEAYNRALALEAEASGALRRGEHEESLALYERAATEFQSAAEEAAEAVNRLQSAEAQRAMVEAKRASEEASAPNEALTLYGRAEAVEREAHRNEERHSYREARELYSEAELLYTEAARRAQELVRRRTAHEQRDAASVAAERATAADAPTLRKEEFGRAAATHEKAKQHLAVDELEAAERAFAEAASAYDEVAEKASVERDQRRADDARVLTASLVERAEELRSEQLDPDGHAKIAQDVERGYRMLDEGELASGADLLTSVSERLVELLEATTEADRAARDAKSRAEEILGRIPTSTTSDFAADELRAATEALQGANAALDERSYGRAKEGFENAETLAGAAEEKVRKRAEELRAKGADARSAAESARDQALAQGAERSAASELADATKVLEQATRTFDSGEYRQSVQLFEHARDRFARARDAAEEARRKKEQALREAQERVTETRTRLEAEAEGAEARAKLQEAADAEKVAEQAAKDVSIEDALSVYAEAETLLDESQSCHDAWCERRAAAEAAQAEARAAAGELYVTEDLERAEEGFASLLANSGSVPVADLDRAIDAFQSAQAQAKELEQRDQEAAEQAAERARLCLETAGDAGLEIDEDRAATTRAEKLLEDRSFPAARAAFEEIVAHLEPAIRQELERREAAARCQKARHAADTAHDEALGASARQWAPDALEEASRLYADAASKETAEDTASATASFEAAAERFRATARQAEQAKSQARDEAIGARDAADTARETALQTEPTLADDPDFAKAADLFEKATALLAEDALVDSKATFESARSAFDDARKRALERIAHALAAAQSAAEAAAKRARDAGAEDDAPTQLESARALLAEAAALADDDPRAATRAFGQAEAAFDESAQAAEEARREREARLREVAAEAARDAEQAKEDAVALGAPELATDAFDAARAELGRAEAAAADPATAAELFAKAQAAFEQAGQNAQTAQAEIEERERARREAEDRCQAARQAADAACKEALDSGASQWAPVLLEEANQLQAKAAASESAEEIASATAGFEAAAERFRATARQAEQAKSQARDEAIGARDAADTARETALRTEPALADDPDFAKAADLFEKATALLAEDALVDSKATFESARSAFDDARKRALEQIANALAAAQSAAEAAAKRARDAGAEDDAPTQLEAARSLLAEVAALADDDPRAATRAFGQAEAAFDESAQAAEEARREREARLREAAAEAARDAEQAKEDAVALGAPELATDAFDAARAELGRAEAAAADPATAAELFAKAQAAFEQAGKNAQTAQAEIEERERTRREAEERCQAARQAADAACKEALDAGASQWAPEALGEADRGYARAASVEAEGDVSQATAGFEEAAQRFHESAQRAAHAHGAARDEARSAQTAAEEAKRSVLATDEALAHESAFEAANRLLEKAATSLAEEALEEARSTFDQARAQFDGVREAALEQIARAVAAARDAAGAAARRALDAGAEPDAAEALETARRLQSEAESTSSETPRGAIEIFAKAESAFAEAENAAREVQQEREELQTRIDEAENAAEKAFETATAGRPTWGERRQLRTARKALSRAKTLGQKLDPDAIAAFTTARETCEQIARGRAERAPAVPPSADVGAEDETVALSGSGPTDADATVAMPAADAAPTTPAPTGARRGLFAGIGVVLVCAVAGLLWWAQSGERATTSPRTEPIETAQTEPTQERPRAEEPPVVEAPSAEAEVQPKTEEEPSREPEPPPVQIVSVKPAENTVTVAEGATAEFAVQTDADVPVRWTIDGRALDSKATELSWTPSFDGATRDVELRAEVGDGATGQTHAWRVAVTNVNRAPTLASATPGDAEVSAKVGDAVRFEVASKDEDGDSLSYAWTVDGKPASDAQPSLSLDVGGDHRVAVEVSDGEDAVRREWKVAAIRPEPFRLKPSPSALEALTYEKAQTFSLAGDGASKVDWSVNGRKVADGMRFTYTPDRPELVGKKGVRVAATATNPDGETFRHEWSLAVRPPKPRLVGGSPSDGTLTVSGSEPVRFEIRASEPVGAQSLSYVFRVDGRVTAKGGGQTFQYLPKDQRAHTVVAYAVDDFGQKSNERRWRVERQRGLEPDAREWIANLEKAFNAKNVDRIAELRGMDAGTASRLRSVLAEQMGLRVRFTDVTVEKLNDQSVRVSYTSSHAFTDKASGEEVESSTRVSTTLARAGGRLVERR